MSPKIIDRLSRSVDPIQIQIVYELAGKMADCHWRVTTGFLEKSPGLIEALGWNGSSDSAMLPSHQPKRTGIVVCLFDVCLFTAAACG